MKIITVAIVNDEVIPVEPLPENSIANKFDGEKYIIYEKGDELPESNSE